MKLILLFHIPIEIESVCEVFLQWSYIPITQLEFYSGPMVRQSIALIIQQALECFTCRLIRPTKSTTHLSNDYKEHNGKSGISSFQEGLTTHWKLSHFSSVILSIFENCGPPQYCLENIYSNGFPLDIDTCNISIPIPIRYHVFHDVNHIGAISIQC